jgi:hypothetical protein
MHVRGDKIHSSEQLITEDGEEYSLPEKERLFIDRSTSIPSLVIDPVKEEDQGKYRWVNYNVFLDHELLDQD